LDRHLLIVANGFRVVGILLGIPALLLCLWLTWGLIELAWLKPDKAALGGSHAINIGRDGIVGIAVALATGVGKAFEFLGGATTFVMRILDITAAALAVVGACLFFTGRGLFLHTAWARFIAGAAASGMLLVSFLALTSLRRGGPFALIPVGVSIYMLWVLARRFN
jgi:hypothetical protein